MRTLCPFSIKECKTNTAKKNNRRRGSCNSKGSLKIVGIGPGDLSHLSQKARIAIEDGQVIVGYKTYIECIKPLVKDKEVYSFPMRKELKRASFSIQKALEGKKVVLISSGDPGVYGMAGVALELLNKEDLKKIELEIIPGTISATASASLLGAPIMHDFVCISLSDILTSLELIKKRIRLASEGDFVIIFYNPKSTKRSEPLEEAWRILMEYKSPNTPVGIVRNAARKDEKMIVTTLERMLKAERIDMVTTIIVGNSQTYVKNGYMITPRGYARCEN